MLYPVLKRCHLTKTHIDLTYKKKNDVLSKGNCGLIALESGLITPNEIEAVRRVAVRNFRLNILKSFNPKIIIRVYPYQSLTKKPNEVRMGKGKGRHYIWVYPIKQGKILFELFNIPIVFAKQLLKEFSSKISVKTKIILN